MACFDVRACAPADNPRACGFQGKHRMYSRCDFAGDRRCDGPRVYKHGYRGGHFRGGPERFAHRRGGECPAFNGRHWRAPEERPCGFSGNTGRPPFRGHYRGESPCFAERHFRGPNASEVGRRAPALTTPAPAASKESGAWTTGAISAATDA